MFFSKNQVIGLNIADNTVEVAALEKSGGQIKVTGLARTVLASGIVQNGRVIEPKKLQSIIVQLFAKAQPNPISGKRVVFCLPENQVYTHVFTIEPYNAKDDIEALAYQEAKLNIPIPEDDLVLSYRLLRVYKKYARLPDRQGLSAKTKTKKTHLTESAKQAMVLLAAASHTVMSEWQQFFNGLKIDVEDFDCETLANWRDLFKTRPAKPVCVVDIGAAQTNIAIFGKSGLYYSHSVPLAGNQLTVRAAKALGISKEEAERKKIKVGLLSKNNALYTVLARNINVIFKNIMEAINFFHEQTGKRITHLVLLGGSAQLKGLVDYLHTNLNLPVSLGKSQLTEHAIPLEYVTAIGTALRGLQKNWDKTDPLLHLSVKTEEKAAKSQARQTKQSQAAVSAKIKKTAKTAGPKVKSTLVDAGIEAAEMEGEEELEEVMDSGVNAGGKSKKLLLQKIIFSIVILGGLSGVLVAWRWRVAEKTAQEAERQQQADQQFAKVEEFTVKAALASEVQYYAPDRITGRIISDTIDASGSYNEALNISKNDLGKKIVEGEIYWLQPLNLSADPSTAVFPITFDWLIYSDKEASKLLLKEIDKLNAGKLEYSLSKLEKLTVEPGEDEGIYWLKAKLTIASVNGLNPTAADETPASETTETSETATDTTVDTVKNTAPAGENAVDNTETPPAPPVGVGQAIILETGTGWLNVRSGAGTSYGLIGKVYTGDSYVVLQKQNGWLELKIGETESGWVIDDYARVSP